MRNAFAKTVVTMAEQDPRVVLLSADIGNRLFDDYKSKFPDRFFNAGVAESNMISMAAGLAMNGMRPICYTITPFITARCLEQIRVDVCYHEQPVIIVGCGAGLSYASLGATHHSCEDIAMLRCLPRMNVVCPGDAHEVAAAIPAALAVNQPVYLRIGKKGEPLVHASVPPLEIGRALIVRPGRDVCLISTGNMLPVADEVSVIMRQRGVSVQVVSCHTIKPLDQTMLHDAFSRFGLVVTVEEHSLIGGLGSAIAEWSADHPHPSVRLLRLGTDDAFVHGVGSQASAREKQGLTAEAIVTRLEQTRITVARWPRNKRASA